jgi:hypothetical protein
MTHDLQDSSKLCSASSPSPNVGHKRPSNAYIPHDSPPRFCNTASTSVLSPTQYRYFKSPSEFVWHFEVVLLLFGIRIGSNASRASRQSPSSCNVPLPPRSILSSDDHSCHSSRSNHVDSTGLPSHSPVKMTHNSQPEMQPTHQPVGDPTESRFLTVPREIRDAIYEAYLVVDGGCVYKHQTNKLACAAAGHFICLDLSLTCRQVADEIRGVALKVNQITFTTAWDEHIQGHAGRFGEVMKLMQFAGRWIVYCLR